MALNITCLSCQTPPRVADAAAADAAATADGAASADSVVVVAQGLGVDILGLQRQTLIDLQQVLYFYRFSFIHSLFQLFHRQTLIDYLCCYSFHRSFILPSHLFVRDGINSVADYNSSWIGVGVVVVVVYFFTMG